MDLYYSAKKSFKRTYNLNCIGNTGNVLTYTYFKKEKRLFLLTSDRIDILRLVYLNFSTKEIDNK